MVEMCTYSHTIGGQTYHCPRREVSRGRCVFHSPQYPSVDEGFLKESIKGVVRDQSGTEVDFRGLYLPFSTQIFDGVKFTKPVYFDYAYFLGQMIFESTVFESSCSFRGVKFQQGLTLKGSDESGPCEIHGPCSFENCDLASADKLLVIENAIFKQGVSLHDLRSESSVHIKNTVFEGDVLFSKSPFHSFVVEKVQFNGRVDFSQSQFNSGLTIEDTIFTGPVTIAPKSYSNNRLQAPVILRRVKFLNKTEFCSTALNDAMMNFEECDMTGARILALPLIDKEKQIQFSEKCTWPKKRFPWSLEKRHYVADEDDQPKSGKLLQVYRLLHNKYYNESNFTLSKDFYISFMTVKGRIETGVSKYINKFYGMVSQYGESVWRPVLTLAIIWLIFPMILLQIGIPLEAECPKKIFRAPIWGEDFADFIMFQGTYWKALWANWCLTTISVFRPNDLRPSTVSWSYFLIVIETLLNALFIAFLAMGIRRIFTPKKPV